MLFETKHIYEIKFIIYINNYKFTNFNNMNKRE